MSPLWGHLAGVVTVVLMLVFIGIWIWAWRPQHKAAFDSLARIPMRDELGPDLSPDLSPDFSPDFEDTTS